MHRFAIECTVEHSFKHNADMERFFVDSDNNGNLQHDSKHIAVQIQV